MLLFSSIMFALYAYIDSLICIARLLLYVCGMDRTHRDMMSHLRNLNRMYQADEERRAEMEMPNIGSSGVGAQKSATGNEVSGSSIHEDRAPQVNGSGLVASTDIGGGTAKAGSSDIVDGSARAGSGDIVDGSSRAGSGDIVDGSARAEDTVIGDRKIVQADPSSLEEHRAELLNHIYVEDIKQVDLSDEEKKYYLNITEETLSFGKSITEQNQKTESFYIGFCQSLGLPPYPVSVTSGVGFLTYLAKTKHYCYNTLSTVTYQSLVRLNVVHTGIEIGLNVRQAMRRKLGEIRISPDTKPGRGGMEPLILDDLKRVITSINEVDPLKPRLASLFLFGLFTGARANTCASVRFRDFHTFRDYSGGKYTVRVNLEQLKGKPGQVFELTLGGNPYERKDTDFLYWINRVFVESVGCSLPEYCNSDAAERKLGKYTRKVWQMTEDCMTRHLKYRLEKAGFPTTQLGFHSLRAGFLACVVLQNLHTNGSLEGVISKSAMIAGWPMFSRVQGGYFKRTTIAALVTTDLVGATQTPKHCHTAAVQSEVPIPDSQISTYDFHSWEPSDPPQDLRSYTFVVKREFVKKVCEYLERKRISKGRALSLWTTALVGYGGKCISSKGAEGEQILQSFSGTKWNCLRQVAGKDINHRISQDPAQVDKIATELFDLVNCTDRLSEEITSEEESKEEEEQKRSSSSRSRRMWTKEEEEILVKKSEEGCNSVQIGQLLKTRTPAAISAHLKVLNARRLREGEHLLMLSPLRKNHTLSLQFQPAAPIPPSIASEPPEAENVKTQLPSILSPPSTPLGSEEADKPISDSQPSASSASTPLPNHQTSALTFQPLAVSKNSSKPTAEQSGTQKAESVSPSAFSQKTVNPPFPVFTTVSYHPESLLSAFPFGLIHSNPSRDATATPPLSDTLQDFIPIDQSSSSSSETASLQSPPSIHHETVTDKPPADSSPDTIDLSVSTPTSAVQQSPLEMKQKPDSSSAKFEFAFAFSDSACASISSRLCLRSNTKTLPFLPAVSGKATVVLLNSPG